MAYRALPYKCWYHANEPTAKVVAATPAAVNLADDPVEEVVEDVEADRYQFGLVQSFPAQAWSVLDEPWLFAPGRCD